MPTVSGLSSKLAKFRALRVASTAERTYRESIAVMEPRHVREIELVKVVPDQQHANPKTIPD